MRRVLAELREDSRAGGDGLALREIGRRVKQEFEDGDVPWLHAAVESLCKDGLAKVSPVPRTTGMPEAVAEERASYGTEHEESPEAQASSGTRSLEQKVSLP